MLDINDFEKTGEYRDVRVGEYFLSWLRNEPMLCTHSEKFKLRHILKPKEETMRTKDVILNDAGISSIGMMSELELEILVDIRDQLLNLVMSMSNINVTLENIETGTRQGR